MAMKAHQNRRYNESTLVIGVDIAKRIHVAVAEGPGGTFSKPFNVANTEDGFKGLEAWIAQMVGRYGTSEVVIAFEPTGHYWKSLAEWLVGKGHALRLVSPVLTKRAKDMLDGSPLKSDAKDARVIADLTRQGKSRPLVIHAEVFQELRYLSEQRNRLVSERTALHNRLHRLLDILFPELLEIFYKLDGKSFLALLRVAPTPADVLTLGVEGLAEVFRAASRKRYGLPKALEVVAAAQRSIACRSGIGALRFELELLLNRIELTTSQVARAEIQLLKALERVDYAKLLLGVPGLGPITVATVLGELGDLRNYHHPRQVLKMAGLNLFEASSGQHKGTRRITKRGRPLLRKILYMAAIRMQQKGKPLHGLQQKFATLKPGPKVAVAGMRRLLKAMFVMVRDGRAFDQAAFEVRPAMMPAAKLAA